jgi:amino acid transporter
MTERPTLRRRLSLSLMVLYGLGTTIGAGIYALIGKVAGAAGIYAPLAFAIAALLAGCSAFAFAELVARFPSSAGEARYVREAFRSNTLSLAVGVMVVLAGSVSAAVIANGFAGYFEAFFAAPRPLVVATLVVGLGLIAAWGIGESVATAGVMTLIEAGGLVLVIWAGAGAPAARPFDMADLLPPLDAALLTGVLAGSFLAFYAFIGFEDMVNVAEEVKDATRVLPKAIIATLAITLLFYIALAVVAVRVLPIDELAASTAPLSDIYERGTGSPATAIGAIALVATLNGALIQIIMAARVLYGLAAQGRLPAPLARVNRTTRTPLLATALVTAVILVLAIALPIVPLAQATSALTLTIFALVNLALWRIKRRDPRPLGIFTVPGWVPVVGFFVSAGFLVAALLNLVAN